MDVRRGSACMEILMASRIRVLDSVNRRCRDWAFKAPLQLNETETSNLETPGSDLLRASASRQAHPPYDDDPKAYARTRLTDGRQGTTQKSWRMPAQRRRAQDIYLADKCYLPARESWSKQTAALPCLARP